MSQLCKKCGGHADGKFRCGGPGGCTCKPKPETPDSEQGKRRSSSACSADVVSDFIAAMEQGKLQQCIHDEWRDVDPEQISIGYMVRAWKFRIKKPNSELTDLKSSVE